MDNSKKQVSRLTNLKNPEAVLVEIKRLFSYTYNPLSFKKVSSSYKLIYSLFMGDLPGYRKCNTEYHNIFHTLDAFLATARLIDGRALNGNPLEENRAVNLLIASLAHDSGYIQEDGDTEGTGAKYTKIHVERSIYFLSTNRSLFGLDNEDFIEVSKFIACTGLNSNCLEELTGEQREAGSILGSADLLGQMSDRAYLEKLLFLYYEFNEAGMEGFDTEFDILRKTLAFYENTMKRLDETLLGTYHLARQHFRVRHGADENLYITAINNQIDYLKKIIEDETSNFRTKLKRLNFDEVEKRYA